MKGELQSKTIPLSKTTKFIVDNRGRTAPTTVYGIPLIATNCISNDQLYPAYEKLRFVSKETYANWFRAHPQPGDIILTNKGSQNGAICLVPNPVDFVIAQDMVALRADEKIIDPLFLFAALRSQDVQREIKNLDVSGVIPHFKKTDFDKLRLPYPKRDIQEVIGRIYYDFSTKIELNRRMNATLEAMARALFQSWFVDFDPVRAKLDGRKPIGLDVATATLFPSSFQESSLGPIPHGWTAQRLPDAIDVNPRRTLKGGAIAPYLDMKNLPTQGHSAAEVIDRAFSSGTKFQNGDTLLARITPCLENGKTGYVDFLEDGQVGWGSTEYIIFSPKRPLPPQFGYLLARSDALRTHAIQNMTGTSGRQRVPSECFNTFWLAIPPLDVALCFDKLTAPLMAKIKANSNESRTLATLRDTLLPKLLSGELSLRPDHV